MSMYKTQHPGIYSPREQELLEAATNHGSCGQCMLLHGYVTDKYVNDAGEHLVDLTCWAETWDHKLTQVIGTSVVLPSRG